MGNLEHAPRIRRWVREDIRRYLRASLCEALSQTSERTSASRDRTGCLDSIFKMWPDKYFVQGEKNAGGKGRVGSFQIKQNLTDLNGSAYDIILSTEHCV